MLEKYNFLRKYNFSLQNLSEKDKEEHPNFNPKSALLLDILNDKEQKQKLILWKYFCIWRGNAINRYSELGDVLKFIRGESLTYMRGDFIETLKQIKNPRLYSIALKKFLMNLFHKNIDLLRDAFNRWKKVTNKEDMNLLKSKLFYSLCKKNDEKNKDIEDGVSEAVNTVDNLRKRKKIVLKGPYPDEVKNILSLYFRKWKGEKGLNKNNFFFGKKTISLPDNMKKYVFKKDKISQDFIQALLSNIPEEEKENEMQKWIQHPLRRMVVLRYRRERMNIFRYLLKWYNKVRLILAIEHLERIVKGREKLTNIMRFKPLQMLYKKMKLMNPKFYKSKGEKLVKVLLDIAKYNPYKRYINNMRLFNRVNKLRAIQPKTKEKVANYILKKYFEKWKQNLEEIKEQKIKLLLTYVKKRIKDEKIINQQRKNELLKRFILNKEKNKINSLLLAFKIWEKLAKLQKETKPLIRENKGNIISILNGEEKIINGNNIKEGGEINIKLIKNKEGEFTIDNIINNNLTEEQRQEMIKRKMPNTIHLIDDKIKSLMQMKLYKWKNITNKIICDDNARIIQRFLRKKMGILLWKKRVKFFRDLAKKYIIRKIFDFARVNNLDKNSKMIIYRKLMKNLRKIDEIKNHLISLNENIINANENLKNQNKTVVLKNIIKLYAYIIISKLFEKINNLQRNESKIMFKDFFNRLKQNTLKKSEYTYKKKISNENIPFRKKLSFSRKKTSNNIPQNEINKSIPYISLIPHLIQFLQEKIYQRKNYAFNKLKQQTKNLKLTILLNKYINSKLIPDKNIFFKKLYKLATNGEKHKKLFSLLRKYIIKNRLFLDIDKPVRLLHLAFLIKVSIVNQEISDKRYLRVIIRKWRFLTFSHNISKKKMSALYKNFHINYLEMVNDVFGEEQLENPSVIKEFERFGANVGMWENERPNFTEGNKFCKKVQKKFFFHRPKTFGEKEIMKSNEKMEEVKDVKEIKEDKKVEKNIKERKEDKKEEDDNKQTKGKRRYFRNNLKNK